MSKIKSALTLWKTDKTAFKVRMLRRFANKKISHLIPDKMFLKMLYKANYGKKLNLKNPQGFNEKLQWLKLYARDPKYSALVDKYEVKEIMKREMGEEFVIPTYGVWDRFDDIDFDALPEQFVLKCTHDSGSVAICRDKATFDIAKAREKIENNMKKHIYWNFREWPYKNVKPRILAEAYMEDAGSTELIDYKFYCFNGVPKFLYVSQGLSKKETATISFLTLDWQFAPYERCDFRPLTVLPEKPKTFDKMVEFAEKLSAGMEFLRVDLYEINGKLYFSELTFSPCAGFMPFRNPEHDLEVGQMLKLPDRK